MKNMCTKYKNKIIYLLPPLIVMIIMLTIFLLKGMYPFGTHLTLQMDDDPSYVPVLFKIHDIFHYGDSVLWDFKLGGGANIYGSLVLNSIYSPLNWLVIFVRRNNIVNFFDILLIIKFMCMSSTMFFFIRKNFKKVDVYWQVLLSILYVFSSWGYLMYSNIFFIDTVILFPIIMHFLIKLFKEEKCLGFILTLSYSLMLNISLTYMIYLFIIFSSFIAIIFLIKKSKRKKIIFNLSISLIISILIAAIAYIPTVIQMLFSVRSSILSKNGYFEYLFLKIINLTMSSILILNFIRFCFNKRNISKNKKCFYLFSSLLLTIGVIVEPINIAWHIQPYFSFPYRYSFIFIFLLICFSLENINKKNSYNFFKKYKNLYTIIIIIFTMFCCILFWSIFKYYFLENIISYYINAPMFLILILFLLFFSIIYFNILKVEHCKTKKILFSLLTILEIFTYSSFSFNDFGYSGSNRMLEYEKNISIKDNQLYKYSDYTNSNLPNSSYITRNATISNWLHINPTKQLKFINKFGYYIMAKIIINGNGGTEFSNLILSVNSIYSPKKIQTRIYDLKKKFDYNNDTVYFYKNKYDTSFGFLYDNNFLDSNSDNYFYNQNYYYKNYFMKNKNIITSFSFDIYNKDKYNYIKSFNYRNLYDENLKLLKNLNTYNLNWKNDDNVFLYVNVNQNLLNSNLLFKIDDDYINFISYKGIVYLGEYDSDIDIEIIVPKNQKINLDNIEFGYIKLDDYIELVDKLQVKYNVFEFNKNQLHINIDSDKEQYLFLPINNIDGWKCKINGKEVKIENTMYTFMSIKLNKGNNDIRMVFYPPYLKEGILISIIGVLMLIMFIIFKNKIYEVNFIRNFVVFMYYFVSIVLFIYVYIISNFIFV